MQPTLFRAGPALLAVALALLPGPALAATEVPGLVWGVPFLGMLLSIALVPIVAPRLWNRRMGTIALAWAAALLVPQTFVSGIGLAAGGTLHALLADYLPFVTLLLAMYAVGGGVLIQGGPWGRPAGNTALLAIATLCAGLVGPLATSMVLIHPLLRANAHRRRKVHLVVFFIVLVCNVGGVTTPLGNPPLYIGLLQGVPFLWPIAALWKLAAVLILPLLALFWLIDRHLARTEPPPAAAHRLHVRGWFHLGLLAMLVMVVLAQSLWPLGNVAVLGVEIGLSALLGAAVFTLTAVVASRATPLAVRQGNMLSWAPMVEVAQLFAGIFVTIVPVLGMIEAGVDGPLGAVLRLAADAGGRPWPTAYFWLSGILSAFLDNAPTYFMFFRMAGGDAARLTGVDATTLMAMSAGSVCFGALTYIGNAPNMMVRGVAAHRGVRMPGFFGYMAYACALLLPGFVLLTLLFFI